MERKRKANSTQRGAIKQHLKQLPSATYNAYYNYLKGLQMETNRANTEASHYNDDLHKSYIRTNALSNLEIT